MSHKTLWKRTNILYIDGVHGTLMRLAARLTRGGDTSPSPDFTLTKYRTDDETFACRSVFMGHPT